MDRQAYANRILATGAEPRRLGQLEEHGGSGVERVDLHTHPKKITFNHNPHPHLRRHTYQHDDSTILRLSTPVLCRVSWIAGPIVRLTSSGRVHDSAIQVDSHVEHNSTYVRTPAEGYDGLADDRILVDRNDLLVHEDGQVLAADS